MNNTHIKTWREHLAYARKEFPDIVASVPIHVAIRDCMRKEIKELRARLEEAELRNAEKVNVDPSYIYQHALTAGNCLMRARTFLQGNWYGALDDALTHVDIIMLAVTPPAVPAQTKDK